MWNSEGRQYPKSLSGLAVFIKTYLPLGQLFVEKKQLTIVAIWGDTKCTETRTTKRNALKFLIADYLQIFVENGLCN